MKAEDLRIGNYVYELDEIGRVSGISNDGRVKMKFRYTWASIDVIKPILLTEEWLVDLGFDDNDFEFELKAGRKKIIFSWSVKVVRTGKRSCFYSSKYKHVKFVHQLQNLYFALTGKELTK